MLIGPGRLMVPSGAIAGAGLVNSLRNATMAGAVAGSPGTYPTNWSASISNAGTVVGTLATGSDGSGVPYLDVRYAGTPAGLGAASIRMESSTQIAAAVGQVWRLSALVTIAAGAMTNASTDLAMDENTAGGGFVNFNSSAFVPGASRVSFTRTLTGGTTGAVRPMIRFVWSGAGAIDMTLRISAPRMERLS